MIKESYIFIEYIGEYSQVTCGKYTFNKGKSVAVRAKDAPGILLYTSQFTEVPAPVTKAVSLSGLNALSSGLVELGSVQESAVVESVVK